MFWLLNMNNAPSNAPSGDMSQLELYFGGMVLFALVTLWLWLWLRTREPLRTDAENES